jgi:hypothetical protein
MTVTGNAGIGPVDFSAVLADGTLDGGYVTPSGTLGTKTVGPDPTGPIDSPISLTISLTDTAAPGSNGLTLKLSGSLTGQFLPYNAPNSPNFGDPSVMGRGTINAITVSGNDPATNQVVSVTTQAPNGMLSAAALAQFASIGSIPQPLLATLTTPGRYRFMPTMGGGVNGIYSELLWITPLSQVAAVPAPEPAPFALLGFASVAYLVRRARAARQGSARCS